MRRAARERFDGMNVDWAGIADLEGEAAAEAFGIIAGEVEGQVSWRANSCRRNDTNPIRSNALCPSIGGRQCGTCSDG